ncbi:MAG: ABC transporter ATP-binding protein [Pseudomonadales bacterium]|jgi:lipooligosaccharide transport system ATP-binding protein|nr:ABC transporter ATP-binding protein [Pseudomonadales bacterium]
MAMIEARGLVKRYGELTAVDGLSFAVEEGETFGLLGPNGAGKTTTMRMLAGLCPISAGTLHVAGLDVAREARAVRRFLGVVTQADGLDTELTVRGNLEVFADLSGLSRAAARARADEVLAFLDLADKADESVDALSGGMKRRLAIARALVPSPRVIVLDEPSTGLDPESRVRVWEELASLKRSGVTLLLSTHYMDEAELLCDRIAVMHSGRILDVGTPAELVARHGGGRVTDLRPSGARRETIREALSAAGVPFREMGAVFRVSADGATLPALEGVTVSERAPNLEDVFLKVAGRGLSEA